MSVNRLEFLSAAFAHALLWSCSLNKSFLSVCLTPQPNIFFIKPLINPLLPYINMHILHTTPWTFPRVLTRSGQNFVDLRGVTE